MSNGKQINNFNPQANPTSTNSSLNFLFNQLTPTPQSALQPFGQNGLPMIDLATKRMYDEHIQAVRAQLNAYQATVDQSYAQYLQKLADEGEKARTVVEAGELARQQLAMMRNGGPTMPTIAGPSAPSRQTLNTPYFPGESGHETPLTAHIEEIPSPQNQLRQGSSAQSKTKAKNRHNATSNAKPNAAPQPSTTGVYVPHAQKQPANLPVPSYAHPASATGFVARGPLAGSSSRSQQSNVSSSLSGAPKVNGFASASNQQPSGPVDIAVLNLEAVLPEHIRKHAKDIIEFIRSIQKFSQESPPNREFCQSPTMHVYKDAGGLAWMRLTANGRSAVYASRDFTVETLLPYVRIWKGQTAAPPATAAPSKPQTTSASPIISPAAGATVAPSKAVPAKATPANKITSVPKPPPSVSQKSQPPAAASTSTSTTQPPPAPTTATPQRSDSISSVSSTPARSTMDMNRLAKDLLRALNRTSSKDLSGKTPSTPGKSGAKPASTTTSTTPLTPNNVPEIDAGIIPPIAHLSPSPSPGLPQTNNPTTSTTPPVPPTTIQIPPAPITIPSTSSRIPTMQVDLQAPTSSTGQPHIPTPQPSLTFSSFSTSNANFGPALQPYGGFPPSQVSLPMALPRATKKSSASKQTTLSTSKDLSTPSAPPKTSSALNPPTPSTSTLNATPTTPSIGKRKRVLPTVEIPIISPNKTPKKVARITPPPSPNQPLEVPLFLPETSPAPELDTMEVDDMPEAVSPVPFVDIPSPKSPTRRRRLPVPEVVMPPHPPYLVELLKKKARSRRMTSEASETRSVRSSRANSSGADTTASYMLNEPPDQEDLKVMWESSRSFRTCSCKWKDCSVALSSARNLYLHLVRVHGGEASAIQSSLICAWQTCGRMHKDRAALNKHFERHSIFPLQCKYQDCEVTALTPRALQLHHSEEHKPEEPTRPYLEPFLPQPPLPEPPDLPSTLPPYVMTAQVRPAHITQERHNVLGPWVLKRMSGSANKRPKRHNVAAVQPSSSNPYGFLAGLTSSLVKPPAMEDLNSPEVSYAAHNGMVFWPAPDVTVRLPVDMDSPENDADDVKEEEDEVDELLL